MSHMSRPLLQNIPGLAPGWQRMLPFLPLAAGLALGWGRRRQMRSELRRSRRALQATWRQLDAILRGAPVGIAQTDLHGRYVLANARYCGILGRPESELRRARMVDLTHPDDAAQQREEQEQMLRTGAPFSLEKRYLRPDASEVWVVTHMSVLLDPSGHPSHMLAAVQDITHRRAAEAALRTLAATIEKRVADAVAERAAASEELRQAQRLEALGQLAGGVAHDFNNVLQAIAGGARLMQRRPEDRAGVERLAALIVDATERGAGVTRRLLSFARLGDLQPEPVDVAQVLHELHDALRGLPGAPLAVTVDAPRRLPWVMADRAQLETVLMTLAANAREAMATAGTGGTLRLRAAADTATDGRGRTVRIEMEDNGPGMDSDILQHAAEPFFSTKPRGRGTGLGLAMARGFAEQSGGRLLLRSEPGQGTTAVLWLPEAGTAPAPVVRVMLVDDDADVRGVLAEILQAAGCTVTECVDAAGALARMDAGEVVDLVISDLSMPGTDGLTLIRAMQDRRPGLPAILLTGHGGSALQSAVGGMAAVRLVGKPVRGATLMRHVSALLDR